MYCVQVRILATILLALSTVSISTAADADKIAELEKRVAALEGNMESLQTIVTNNASQISELKNLVEQSFTKLADQGAQQQALLDTITGTDDEGEVYVALNGIMQNSAEGRREVRKAVERSIRSQGTLTIINEMGTAQDVLVNRVQHQVQAGATLNLKVPVGTVTTQLPGQEIVNWTIGVPNYEQSVTIKPRYTTARVTTEPARSTVWVSRPIYEQTPYYYNDLLWDWGGYVVYP